MKVDRSAIAAGAGVGVAVAGVVVILAKAISSLTDVNANLPLYFVLLAGLGAGGGVAARRQPRSPLTHGALAAVAALVVVVIVLVMVRLALGREQANPISLVFHLLMASSAGIFGGYLGARRTGPPRSRTSESRLKE